LTSHARVLLCIARDPGVRLRDIAASVGITERSAHGIITDLTQAGYLAKQKDGRRNRYQIPAHLPLPEPASRTGSGGGLECRRMLRSTCSGSLNEFPAGSRPYASLEIASLHVLPPRGGTDDRTDSHST
jgi:hypothetical protein